MRPTCFRPLAFNEPELMLRATLEGLDVDYLLDREIAPYVANGQLVRLLAGRSKHRPSGVFSILFVTPPVKASAGRVFQAAQGSR